MKSLKNFFVSSVCLPQIPCKVLLKSRYALSIAAGDLLKKAKEAGRKIGDQIDESLDAIKGKKDRGNNQNGGGI